MFPMSHLLKLLRMLVRRVSKVTLRRPVGGSGSGSSSKSSESEGVVFHFFSTIFNTEAAILASDLDLALAGKTAALAILSEAQLSS